VRYREKSEIMVRPCIGIVTVRHSGGDGLDLVHRAADRAELPVGSGGFGSLIPAGLHSSRQGSETEYISGRGSRRPLLQLPEKWQPGIRGVGRSVRESWRIARRCTGFLLACGALAACGSTALHSAPAVAQLKVPRGFHVQLVASGLHEPTSLAYGPDHRLYVTQLHGGENAGNGQVVVLDPRGGSTIVLSHLEKPTGLVWLGRELYIQAGRDILRARLKDGGGVTAPATIVRRLPFNGRSEGQLDLTAAGTILFEASGLVGESGAGRLLTLSSTGRVRTLATGFKNAYAHALDSRNGDIFTTDVGQDYVNGNPPPEEIDLVKRRGNYGWPRCYGDRLPARNFHGTASYCATTESPIITFPPHSTPTGLTWYGRADFPAGYRDVLYVALFDGTPAQIDRVTLHPRGGRMVGTATRFIIGLERPIDVLPDQQRGLLVLDFASGSIVRLVAG